MFGCATVELKRGKNETKELEGETETIMRNKTEWNWIIYQLWSALLTTSTSATVHMYAKWQLKQRTHEIKDEIRYVDKRDGDGAGHVNGGMRVLWRTVPTWEHIYSIQFVWLPWNEIWIKKWRSRRRTATTKQQHKRSETEAEQNIRLKFKFKSTFQAGGKFMHKYFSPLGSSFLYFSCYCCCCY